MSKIFAPVFCLIIAAVLASCYFPAPKKMEVPEYSDGPISDSNFLALVENVIPEEMGKVRIAGRVNWAGFTISSSSWQLTSPYYKGVVAFTDTNLLMLLWSEETQRFEILERVPYAEIRYRPKNKKSSILHLYLGQRSFVIGDTKYTSLEKTYMQFLHPTKERGDLQTVTLAHHFLMDKVEIYVAEKAPVGSGDYDPTLDRM